MKLLSQIFKRHQSQIPNQAGQSYNFKNLTEIVGNQQLINPCYISTGKVDKIRVLFSVLP